MAVLAPIESHTEEIVSIYAEARGCLQVKLTILGRVGWPDRLYLYKGKVLFIEFKRLGEKPKKIQLWMHSKIISHGFQVVVVDTISEGKDYIDGLIG